MITIRQALMMFAFAATVAAAITGATLRGETKETSVVEACARAEWPVIPANCLDGAANRSVRYVSMVTAEQRAVETVE